MENIEAFRKPGFQFENFYPLDSPASRACFELIEHSFSKTDFLLIRGTSHGNGATHLSMAVYNELTKRGQIAFAISTVSLYLSYRSQLDMAPEEWVDNVYKQLSGVKFLIIDQVAFWPKGYGYQETAGKLISKLLMNGVKIIGNTHQGARIPLPVFRKIPSKQINRIYLSMPSEEVRVQILLKVIREHNIQHPEANLQVRLTG